MGSPNSEQKKDDSLEKGFAAFVGLAVVLAIASDYLIGIAAAGLAVIPVVIMAGDDELEKRLWRGRCIRAGVTGALVIAAYYLSREWTGAAVQSRRFQRSWDFTDIDLSLFEKYPWAWFPEAAGAALIAWAILAWIAVAK